MEKSAEAFRTISEVADILQTPAHVLRFWESRFPQIKPVKRAGGRRYYRPSDIALLSGIRRLLHDDGMTIRGVQKILREQGVRHVAGMADTGEEAGFVEVEIEDEVHTAEVHAFPRRAKDDDESGWTFGMSDPSDIELPDAPEFAAPEVEDETPPAPMGAGDSGAAQLRAERLRMQPMQQQPYDLPHGHIESHEGPVNTDNMILRLRRLPAGSMEAVEITEIHARLALLRDRLQTSQV